MRRNRIDLIITIIFAALAIILASFDLLTFPLFGLLFGLPLVIFLPGYSLVSLIFPARSLDLWEKTLLTSGLSLALTAGGGILLNLLPAGLTPLTWALLLGSFTIVFSAATLVRHKQITLSNPEFSLPGPVPLLFFILALFIIGLSFFISYKGKVDQSSPGFTQLWMIPQAHDNQKGVTLGISSQESGVVLYKLKLLDGDTVIKEWSNIELRPGQKWENKLDLPPRSGVAPKTTLKALLYRLDKSDTVYRNVSLADY